MKAKYLLCGIVMFLMCSAVVHAEELKPVEMTGYCLKGIMANGEKTHAGVCAYRKCDVGKIAVLYDENKELIGKYEIADVGGTKAIKKGYVVDVWFPTAKECFAFTKKGYIQIKEEN